MIGDTGIDSSFREMFSFQDVKHHSLFFCRNYPVDRGKEATVGITKGTHDLRKEDLCLEKLISDENRATFSVIKRRKKEKLVINGGGKMIMASVLLVRTFTGYPACSGWRKEDNKSILDDRINSENIVV